MAEDRRSLWSELRELYALSPSKRRRQFYLVLGLMLVGTLAELATIGAVLPFIALLADQEVASDTGWIGTLLDFLALGGAGNSLLAITALFVAVVLVAGTIRLQLAWSTRSFVSGLGHDFAVEIQRRTLSQPYSFHIAQNTSRFLASLEKVQSLVFDVLLQFMQGGIALFMALFIVAALVAVDPIVALASAVAFAAIYALISAFTAPPLKRNSETLRTTYDQRIRLIQESLGGIREVIIDGSRDAIIDEFEPVDRCFSMAKATTAFMASAPRFVIEAIGTALIAIVAFAIARRDGSIAAALPILGAFAVGAQRLLPLIQQIYAAWSNLAGRRSIVSQVLELLRLPMNERPPRSSAVEPLPFRKRITFERVSFRYPGRRGPAVDDVTLEIPRGARVGFVGPTGSGKSTLADLLMGLLEPSSGRIAVDGVALTDDARLRWHRSIAHVPQSIFLVDASIARNVAFGVPGEEQDLERIARSARTAQLERFIAELPDSFETRVGERGIHLSGGQRQRLGIARAIYKQAPVLVLDEATSGLDESTEAAVMDALLEDGGPEQTIIIIAHRPSTIARCDIIVRLDSGRIVAAESDADAVAGPENNRKSRS